MTTPDRLDLLEQTAEIVSAYVSKNNVRRDQLVKMIEGVFNSLEALGASSGAMAAPKGPLRPAVPIAKSVTPEFLYSLEDGRPYQSLRRHLMAKYGLTPEAYREKWGLPPDYPMAAPAYKERRSNIAKTTYFGKNR